MLSTWKLTFSKLNFKVKRCQGISIIKNTHLSSNNSWTLQHNLIRKNNCLIFSHFYTKISPLISLNSCSQCSHTSINIIQSTMYLRHQQKQNKQKQITWSIAFAIIQQFQEPKQKNTHTHWTTKKSFSFPNRASKESFNQTKTKAKSCEKKKNNKRNWTKR